MAKKRHTLEVTNPLVRQIDCLLPKLKYSASISRLIRWLENFDEADVSKAIDILQFLEYIDFYELTDRINTHLKEALNDIPADHFVIIYPCVVEYPKSTDLINYVIKQTPAYSKRGNSVITRDLAAALRQGEKTSVIFVDDFIGSGKSFGKGYDTKSTVKALLDSQEQVLKRYMIAAAGMVESEIYIKSRYPEVTIFTTFRNKLFDPATSVYQLTGTTNAMKTFSYSYGRLIPTINYHPYNTPLGFDESESLVAFDHTTPNNTLPIIWGDRKWYALYPRFGNTKIQQAKALKREVAYYLGIMNRLGLDLYDDHSIIVAGKRIITYNKFEDHSLLTVLKLQIEGFPAAVICHMIGITLADYAVILAYGRTKKLIDRFGEITSTGRDFYQRLMQKVRGTRFRKKDKAQFEMKVLNYIPKSFMGKA